MGPVPPDAAPERFIVDELAGDGGTLTLSVKGVGVPPPGLPPPPGGVPPAGGAGDPCAAYSVKIVFLSISDRAATIL